MENTQTSVPIDDPEVSDTEFGATIGGVGGATVGLAAGSMLGPVGALVGAAIGGLAGAVASGMSVGVVESAEEEALANDPELLRAAVVREKEEAVYDSIAHENGGMSSLPPVDGMDPLPGRDSLASLPPTNVVDPLPSLDEDANGTVSRRPYGIPDTRGMGEKVADALSGDRIDDKTGQVVKPPVSSGV